MKTYRYKDHPLIAADAPSGCPHVLEVLDDGASGKSHKSSASTTHQLCDYIATILDNFEPYPKALEDFFDPAVKTFGFSRFYGPDTIGSLENFLIYREANEVTVSLSHLAYISSDQISVRMV